MESIKIYHNQGDVLIIFGGNYRNKNWADQFGGFQSILNEHGSNLKRIRINFTECFWIDPIPILSLIISLFIFKRNSKNLAEITVAFSNTLDGHSRDQEKMMKFLYSEGFFEQFFLVPDCNVYFNTQYVHSIASELLVGIKKSKIELNYSNCRVLPCRIQDLSIFRKDFVGLSNWIDELISEIEVNCYGKESERNIEELLFKSKVFLDETIQNVLNHAYPDEPFSYVGIYIRYRFGFSNNELSSEEKDRLEKNINSEIANCPLLDKQYIEITPGFLEIFIVDNGIGIPKSYGQGREGILEFRRAFTEILKEGKRRRALFNKSLTEKGGLHLIYNLFEKDMDYICGKSEDQWVGDIIPIQSETSSYNQTSKDTIAQTKGHSWLARISVRNSQTIDSKIWKYREGSSTTHPFLEAINDGALETSDYLSININDYRFKNARDSFTFYRKKVAATIPKFKLNLSTIVILAPTEITKGGVWHLLDECLKDLSNLSDANKRTIIIGDIPESNCILYSASLINATVSDKGWVEQVSGLILITRKLFVCRVQKVKTLEDKVVFRLFTEGANSYFDFYDQQNLNLNESFRDYIGLLKTHDSFLFWFALKNYNNANRYSDQNLFINAEIQWSRYLKIRGYINFPQLLTNSFFINFFSLLLDRCAGLANNNSLLFSPLDTIVKPLIDEKNSFLSFTTNLPDYEMRIGSIYVTGVNLDNVSKQRTVLDFYFFIHNDATEKQGKRSLLFFADRKEILSFGSVNERNIYKRIGRTHAIAQHGWKSFRLNRFTDLGESFYERTPRQSYLDWQSRELPIIKIGNYHYEGHNDLVKVDISKAVLHSFKYRGTLANFLVSEFFIALGAQTISDLIDEKFYPEIERKKAQEFEYRSKYEKVAFIVFPPHLNTFATIEQIKKVIKPEFTDKIIALDFIKRSRDGSLLLSPLVRDKLKAIVDSKKKNGLVEAIFFDCTISSGKTRKQIKHILQSLGVSRVITIFILDRNRLPSGLPDSGNFLAYWRLDVPRLGSRDINPIDNILSAIMERKPQFVKHAQERIDQWQQMWSSGAAQMHEINKGIQPTRLTRSIEKIVGIQAEPPFDPEHEKESKIEIKSSYGLTLYACEILAMTGRNDIALELCQREEYNLTPSVIIELLCTQLLLFPDAISKHVRVSMLKEVIDAMLKIDSVNNYTSLAALVLIDNQSLLPEILRTTIIFSPNQTPSSINYDLLIVFGLISSKQNNEDFSFYKFELLLLSKDNDKLFHIYKRVHDEIFEGGVMHSRPLLDLLSDAPVFKKDDSLKNLQLKLENASSSLSKLKYLVEERIKDWYFNVVTFNGNVFQLVKNEIDERYNDCTALENKWDLTQFSTLRKNVEKHTIPLLRKLHDGIFFQLNGERPGERPFRDVIESLINNVINHPNWEIEYEKKAPERIEERRVIKICPTVTNFPKSYQNKNVWVLYDAFVVEEINNLLFNNFYAQRQIELYGRNSGAAHMWVEIHYADRSVELVFINSIDEDFKDVKNKILSKTTYERDILWEKLFCKIDVTQMPQNTIKVDLSLPIIT